MLGRMMIIDSDVSSRFALKARLGAANHRVLTAGSVAEALPLTAGISAVLVRNAASSALASDIATLKRRVSVPVIAICDTAQRQDAFRAGAEYVLDGACQDSVLRARLRCWLAPAGGLACGFAEPVTEFVPPDQIALLTGDAALSSDWRRAVEAAIGQLVRGVIAGPHHRADQQEGEQQAVLDQDSGNHFHLTPPLLH